MTTQTTERIILGIDPGTTIMGYGLILQRGKQIRFLSMGVVKLDKIKDNALKLKKIFESTLSLIDEYHPDFMSIEAPFYSKNVQSMLKLGRAQGVAIAAALYRSIPIHEYSPKQIKQSITGNGNASKEQVAAMLTRLLQIKESSSYLDATDGLAAAVCHYFKGDNQIDSEGGYSGWKTFITQNPDRIKK